MINNSQLTEGNISKALTKLAIPIMATSFLQMAYTMTDMYWIGKIGSEALAAVGTAGFFTWLAMAFILISKIGAEVGVAQSVGKKDIQGTKRYIRHTIQLNVFLALLYSLVLILFRHPLIGFFKLGKANIENMAISYLVIVALGMVFYFINPVFTAILNGYGESKIPFLINAIGLVANMILDPLLVLGKGPVPAMGVKGAAIATVIAQAIVTLVFVINILKRKDDLFKGIYLLKAPDLEHMRIVIKLGLPAALQSGLFTVFGMFIARIIAYWGPTPIAVQKLGSQIEAISWMTAGGFSTALSAFVGQNYGAGQWERIRKGYSTALGIVSLIGIGATLLLYFGAKPIFSIFLPGEEEAIVHGIAYLKILSISQLFMCFEITTAGAFNGLGKTVPPSAVGIAMNALRIPSAMILSSENLLGVNGVWWSISMTSVFKGIILTTWFVIFLKNNPFLQNKKELESRL